MGELLRAADHEGADTVLHGRGQGVDPGPYGAPAVQVSRRLGHKPKEIRHGALQAKLAASLVLPEPRYTAACGYGQSGRVKSTRLLRTRAARIISGATFASRHRSRTASMLN